MFLKNAEYYSYYTDLFTVLLKVNHVQIRKKDEI